MKKLTKRLAAALAVLMLAAMLTACGGGGGSSAEIDGPGVSNETTKALEDAWLEHYNDEANPNGPKQQNTLQKEAEAFLQNALEHMDPETRVVERQYVFGEAGVNGSGNTIWGDVGVANLPDGACCVKAYTEVTMRNEMCYYHILWTKEIGFAVLEYDGLYYWAWVA